MLCSLVIYAWYEQELLSLPQQPVRCAAEVSHACDTAYV